MKFTSLLWIIVGSLLVLVVDSSHQDGAPNVFEFLRRNNDRAKRSVMDDESSMARTQRPFEGFQIFIDGLKSLQERINGPDYFWSQITTTAPVEEAPPTDTRITINSSDETSHELHELLVLIGVLQRLSEGNQKQGVTPATTEHSEDTVAPKEKKDLPMNEVVQEVSRLFQEVYGDPMVTLPPVDFGSPGGPAMLINASLALLEAQKNDYLNRTTQDEIVAATTYQHLFRLQEIIRELETLSFKDNQERITTSAPIPTMATIDEKLPCSAPFIQIAYKMCILPVLDQKLSWLDAMEYCRSGGLELAMDSVVIKTRRYLNNLLGEFGTRERFTVWVGGKQDEYEDGDDTTTWSWQDGIPVDKFLWSKGQPRTHESGYAPIGNCMVLNGFTEYYGASLPCHMKRHFVCQKRI